MYIFFIVLIFIASIFLILVVLAQNPKGGMAANFGVSNQVMGVRQTTDILEKLTWGLAVGIVVLSLCASIAISSHKNSGSRKSDKIIEQVVPASQGAAIPNMIAPIEEGESAE